MAPSGSQKGFIITWTVAACLWKASCAVEQHTDHITRHLEHGGDASTHLGSLHALNEVIYQESRAQAEATRTLIPLELLNSTASDMGNFVRIWDLYYPTYNCPLLKERLGRIGDGGKVCCGVRYMLQDRSCVVYSLGSAGDTSFEQALTNKTSCEVHTFDHTLSQPVQDAVASIPGLSFHPWGMGSPSKGDGLKSLSQIMVDLGHTWIDVLKMDIEGYEWELFQDFYAEKDASLPVTQLLVEFHFRSAAAVFDVLDKLLADGFRVFNLEPNYYCGDGCCARDLVEFAFIKVSPSGHICSPHSHEAAVKGPLPHGCGGLVDALV